MDVQDAERQHDREALDGAGAEHEQHDAGDKVVTFESRMAEKAFSNPALIAACGDTPLRNSSRMRS